MKDLFLLVIALIVTGNINAQSYNAPESVEYDQVNNRYFISNKGAGEILTRNAAGGLSVFTSLPSSPAGLHIEGNTLYVCDGSRVKGYDLASAAEVMNLNLGATFLNGITGDGGSNLYVSDFTAKKIYRVNIASQSFNVFVPSLVKSPNGIIYDSTNSRLIFVSWGSNAAINQVLLADSSVSQVAATALSNCDGITRDCAGNYYVTAWGTQALHRFDSSFSAPPFTVLTGLSSPADICYNTIGDTIAIPNSGNNTVAFYYPNCTGVGIDEKSNDGVEIFPVPSDDVVNILLDESRSHAEISIYDSKGTRVQYGACHSGQQLSISLKDLPGGIYYLHIISGERSMSRKLVKQ